MMEQSIGSMHGRRDSLFFENSEGQNAAPLEKEGFLGKRAIKLVQASPARRLSSERFGLRRFSPTCEDANDSVASGSGYSLSKKLKSNSFSEEQFVHESDSSDTGGRTTAVTFTHDEQSIPTAATELASTPELDDDEGTVATQVASDNEEIGDTGTESTEVISDDEELEDVFEEVIGFMDQNHERPEAASMEREVPVSSIHLPKAPPGGSSLFGSLVPEDVTDIPLDALLESKGMVRSKSYLARGNSARVYDVEVKEDHAHAYLYKVNLKKVWLGGGQGKFWRAGDFAALRVADLPHLSKPLFFRVDVREENGAQKIVYLPANKAKEFGSSLPATAKICVLGQLERKAPGKTLQSLADEAGDFFTPEAAPFYDVALALHDFLNMSHPANFMHRDLNLNNIMYDVDSRSVTIIDTGEALRLRKRATTEEASLLKESPNPASTQKYSGSEYFMAPSVVEQRAYGSEVDLASAAFVLLDLISASDFEKFSEARFAERDEESGKVADLLFGNADPAHFLTIYLKEVGPTSRTHAMLEAHPELHEVIDLAFQASAPGVRGEEAFEKFQKHSYFARLKG